MNAAIAVFVLMVALIIGVTVGRGILRSLAEPLQSLAARMELVGAGDFTQRSSVLANDEIGCTKAHFNSMVEGLQHREFLKDTFGRFLSPSVSEQILKSGTIDLGGEEVMAAILFSDIRGFTTMSEKMGPSELVRFLNEYMAVVVAPIQQEKGVVNKFIGDAILAMFGVPTKLESPCEQALRAAIGMQKCLKDWNRHRELIGLAPVNTGVGIHFGSVVAGNIGSPDRMEYTVIGDTVNIASRIESMTKSLDASILISEQVLNHLPKELKQDLKIVDCGEAALKGKISGVRLYSVQA
jgi:adenylate cyclase